MDNSFLTVFHFAEPGWLWALLLCIPVALWLMILPGLGKNERIRNYADAHLMKAEADGERMYGYRSPRVEVAGRRSAPGDRYLGRVPAARVGHRLVGDA